MMHRVSHRRQKLGELLRHALAELLERDVGDPRVHHVSITEVDVAPDLSHAKVYVTIREGEAASAAALSGLKKASGFLRHQLRGRVELRVIPELRFLYDSSVEHGQRIESLLGLARRDGKSG